MNILEACWRSQFNHFLAVANEGDRLLKLLQFNMVIATFLAIFESCFTLNSSSAITN